MLVNTILNENRLFPSPLHVINGWFVILEKVFRNGYVAAFNTALRSTTEEKEASGHVDVPCSSKLTQHKSTAYWLKLL